MVPFTLILAAACSSPQVPHAGDNPLFALEGAHALLPCATCHGPGTPTAQPTDCIGCHDADRPTPDHYAGEDCVGCHTAVAWTDIIGSQPPDTGTTPTDTDTTPTDTDTDVPFEHPATDETTLCGTCHEADRKDADHYPESDCAVCHTPEAGFASPTGIHPVIVPHEADQIHVCSECHPGGDTTDFDCGTCHSAIFPHYAPANAPGDAANAACLGCHPALRN